MGLETVLVVGLGWLGLMMWEIRVVLRALTAEMSTARWERSVRDRARCPDPEE